MGKGETSFRGKRSFALSQTLSHFKKSGSSCGVVVLQVDRGILCGAVFPGRLGIFVSFGVLAMFGAARFFWGGWVFLIWHCSNFCESVFESMINAILFGYILSTYAKRLFASVDASVRQGARLTTEILFSGQVITQGICHQKRDFLHLGIGIFLLFFELFIAF
ncbi:MAG: hypothetical protein E7045_01675 [Lentisphaerae bacterium]|nr:hypothetical protein [Lentisphaerota bacterium]